MGMLDDRIAVVTGGRGGVGRAVCERFKAEGAIVYAGDLSDGGSVGGDAPAGSFLPLDVTDEAAVMAGFAQVRDTHGRLDILVNAAGIEIEETIETTTLDQWNRIFAINVTGTFLTSKHALPLLRESEGHASIINFGSYDGFIASNYLWAQRTCGLSADDCVIIARNSFEACFVPDEQKAAYIDALRKYCDERFSLTSNAGDFLSDIKHYFVLGKRKPDKQEL